MGLEGVEHGPAMVALGPQPLGARLLVDGAPTGPIGSASRPATATAAVTARTPVATRAVTAAAAGVVTGVATTVATG
ncbi:MAG TPA: hypothetical protein VF228_17165, partial [Iamia sp.]